MGPSLYSTTPTARALLFKPSSRNSNLAIRGSSHLAVTAEKITQGPPDLPSSNVATAFRCAPLAFSSRTASDVTFPLCSGPGECPSHPSESHQHLADRKPAHRIVRVHVGPSSRLKFPPPPGEAFSKKKRESGSKKNARGAAQTKDPPPHRHDASRAGSPAGRFRNSPG